MMRTKRLVLKPLTLVISALVWCTLKLYAQRDPTITTQPVSQSNLAGTSVTFSVQVDGTGPFSYRWQLNGSNLPNNIITTVAGNGNNFYSGDGGAATNTALWLPCGVAFDAANNMFIADTLNGRIRKVDKNGIITTVAGGGSGGDGGPATNASLSSPGFIVLDTARNLYIDDNSNQRIRKVDPNGIITTVAGNGILGYSGDAGPATNASLHLASGDPCGVALDAVGNLYIADAGNNRIRKVDTNGVITTIAGNGSSGYSGDGGTATNASLSLPNNVAFDPAGILYITDQANNRVREVGTNGIIVTLAGNGNGTFAGDGGAATNASLCNPSGVASDCAGNIFISDAFNNRIRKVDGNGIITTVAGNGSQAYGGDGGTAVNASLSQPFGVCLDNAGNVFIADVGNSRIRKLWLYPTYPTLKLLNVGAADAGDYTVVITNAYGSVTSAVATLTVLLPPSILLHPASQGVLIGSNATLSVTAAGTPPLFYCWYLGATNLVQEGTNASLVVTNMSATNDGQYTVVVTNAYGCVTSQIATLTAEVSPLISAQPASQGVVAGTNALFSIVLDWAGPFTYQWQFNGTNLPNNIISTVAGGGSGGDGGAATNAGLYNPRSAVLDAAGNLYIADTWNNRVRKVDTSGIITTVAGNGTGGYSGDGGAATNAELFSPYDVALDAYGNLYIADYDNNRVRKVDPNGIITTVAGDGSHDYYGDGGPATNAALALPQALCFDAAGSLYIADRDNSRVRKVDTTGTITTVVGGGTGGDGGAATNALLSPPYDIALDTVGNLYIADPFNNVIRKVDLDGIITTVAGEGPGGDGGAATNAGLNLPQGLACDKSGNLYISDLGNQRIRKVDGNGIITTVVGTGSSGYSGDGGAGTNATLNMPTGLSIDSAGNLYIADTYNNCIRKLLLYATYPTLTLLSVDPADAGAYTVVVSNANYGSVTSAVATLTVWLPPSILVQPASQGISTGTNAVLTVTASGTPPLYYLWYFNATNLLQAGTNSSLIVANISTANVGQYAVVVTNAYGSVTSEAAALAFPPSLTLQPDNLAVLPGTVARFHIAVGGFGPFTYQWQFNGANLPQNLITTVAGNGTYGYSGDGTLATNASLRGPAGVVLDTAGSLFIADASNHRIRKVGDNGIITTLAGNGTPTYAGDGGPATTASLNVPTGVALAAFGGLYIADQNNNRIRMISTNGIIKTVAGNGNSPYTGDGVAATNATLYLPSGVALDALGMLYIADQRHNRIREVDTNGTISTVAGIGSYGYSGDGAEATNAGLYWPDGVAFDPLGNLYIADMDNSRIRKVDTNGFITTVAGNGSLTYSGDGGAAINASLNAPDGLALDPFGNLYIADTLNNRIRKVDVNGNIITVAGNGTAAYAGDGGSPTSASLNRPTSVASDAAGNLYIADASNNRIRKVYPPGDATLVLANVTPNHAGGYSVVVTSPYGSVTSVVATLTVEAPPIITAQPASQTALLGSSPVFRVAAAGSGPFGYLWYFNSTNLLQSSSSPSFALANISAASAGPYTVVVTNAYGSVTSQVATLALLFPPSVITPPISQTVLPGTNVSLSVTAGGTGPFSYQWRFNGNNLPINIITTVAGNGSGTYAGDGAGATNASLKGPFGVALDAAGNLYIADTTNNRIRMVGADGIITTIAGNGTAGYAGDGAAANNARLSVPCGIVLDASGNLYITDQYNQRIRMVGTNGIITTVAGTFGAGYYGDGGAATNARLSYPRGLALGAPGNLYIADTADYRIRMVGTNGIITTVAGNGGQGFMGDGSAATKATLYYPSGVSLDTLGNLYIADTYNNRIRKVATDGIITTVAGNGTGGFSGDGGAATNASLGGPLGVALDDLGNLFIVDTVNNRIRIVDSTGVISTLAGNGIGAYRGDGGPASDASLNGPAGVAFDASGSLYIADTANNRIRKVPIRGYPILALANVSARDAGDYSLVITSPYGSVTSAVATVTVEAPPVIAVQPANQIAAPGTSPLLSVAVAGSGPFDYSWYFARTNLLQSGPNSTLILPAVSTNDAGSYIVVVTNPYGSVTSRVATLTIAFPPSVTIQPSQTNTAGTRITLSVAVDGPGPFTYQWRFNGTSIPNNIITTFAGNGFAGPSGDGGPATNASLYMPNDVCIDGAGNAYIADFSFHRVRMVNTSGIITTVAGSGTQGFSGDGGPATNASLRYPSGVATDASGNLYIADTSDARIRKVDIGGIITTVAGNGTSSYSGDGGSATNASLSSPSDLALDQSGNLYIADWGNNRLRKVDANGIITTVAGNGSFGYAGDGGAATNASLTAPSVAFDAFGNLYIPDYSNNRIRMVDKNGIITTVAGKTSSVHYSGDGGPAFNACLYSPSGVVLDAAGNCYIADAGNNRIRKVDTNGIITTVAGNGGLGYSGDGGAATNASFWNPMSVTLDAAGNLFITDRSNNRIRKVHFAGDPTLTLASVDLTNAGNYTVVVTSPYGSMTSGAAVLTVTVSRTPPQISTGDANFGFQTNQFGFNLSGAVGQTIVVDGSTDLVGWTPLFTNTVVGNPFYFFDPASTNYPSRFYRARLP